MLPTFTDSFAPIYFSTDRDIIRQSKSKHFVIKDMILKLIVLLFILEKDVLEQASD